MRNFVRGLIGVLFGCLTFPFWASVRVGGLISEGAADQLFASSGQWLSLIPGAIGVWARRAFYRKTLQQCGNDFSIGFLSWVAHRASVVGRNVYVGAYCVLGTVELGNDILIGTGVQILSGRHQHIASKTTERLVEQIGQYRRTTIGSNVWIGSSAVVMANVGDDCIVGAGSVVVHAVPANRVAVGNPARPIRALSINTEEAPGATAAKSDLEGRDRSAD